MATSTDGATWVAVTQNVINSIKAIAYGNGKFVAGSWGDKMAISTDGVIWTPVSNSTFSPAPKTTIYAIAYGNNKFVAAGTNDEYCKLTYSPDGITWKTTIPPWSAASLHAIAYGNNKFVVVGEGGKIAYSSEN